MDPTAHQSSPGPGPIDALDGDPQQAGYDDPPDEPPDAAEVDAEEDERPGGAARWVPGGGTPRLARAGATARCASSAADDGRLVEWLQGVVEHDERALAALYDASVARVHGIVARIVRRPALAEEVVEDTYYQVWRQAARFDPARGGALTWLLAMARSRAIDAVRREARHLHASLDDEGPAEPADDCGGADDLLAVAREHADLHRALMLLNAQPRQLVALAFFSGLSHEDIASQTRLPLGTVKSQIRRALATLRRVLGDARVHALAQ